MIKKLAKISEHCFTTINHNVWISFVLIITLPSLQYNPSIVLAANLSSSTYSFYVDGSKGSDLNLGTLTLPWKTVQKAVNNAVPGATIFIAKGTYHESVNISISGTEEFPIKLVNYNDSEVKIDGGTNPAIVPYTSQPQYWIIQGLNLLSSGPRTVEFNSWGNETDWRGINNWTFRENKIFGSVWVYGAYNLFEGNEIIGNTKYDNGIWEAFGASHHNTYRKNDIHNFNLRGIWSMKQTHDDIFDGNIVHDITDPAVGQCIDLDGFGSVEWRQTVHNNTLYNCPLGVELENTFDSHIEENVISNNNFASVMVINYGATIQSPGDIKCQVGGENNQYGDIDGNNDCEGNLTKDIINKNTISNSGENGLGAIQIHSAGGVSILNNIITKGSKAVLIFSGNHLTPGIIIRKNIFSRQDISAISMTDITTLEMDSENIFINSNPKAIYEKLLEGTFLTLSDYQHQIGKGKGSIYKEPNLLFLPIF